MKIEQNEIIEPTVEATVESITPEAAREMGLSMVAEARLRWESEARESAAATEAAHRAEAESAREVEAELRRQLAESERARLMRERELECARALDEAGLPQSLVPILVSADADEMGARIALIASVAEDVAARAVRDKLGDLTPRASGKQRLTRAAIRDLSLDELQAMHERGAGNGFAPF